MYRKSPKGWAKHLDFCIIDIMCLQIAFLLAYCIRNGWKLAYIEFPNGSLAVIVTFFSIFVGYFIGTYKDITRRGVLKELLSVIKHTIWLVLLFCFYLFMTKQSQNVSRMFLGWFFGIFAVLSFLGRLGWKNLLRSRGGRITEGSRSMILVSTKDRVKEVVDKIERNNYSGIILSGLVLMDDKDNTMTGKEIEGIKVVADLGHISEYIRKSWVDEVFICLADNMVLDELIKDCREMGVTVHLELAERQTMQQQRQIVERIGGYTVLSSCENVATWQQLFLKRAMDICGGLAGCLVTLILTIFIGPAIYIKSPGPIFFSQIRVGKNGKKFKMYKFRSMYPDAEARKAELMAQNKVKDGMMFKMENDPRIIGGENGKGIGNFIRNTSLDEFPQFWNVLKGDMSLVGTRPPTVDEWDKYELHHRARLAIKPGLTGMWQVSGRSDITDFEEVVRLDTEYIQNWSFGLDIKILLKTVEVVLKGSGAE